MTITEAIPHEAPQDPHYQDQPPEPEAQAVPEPQAVEAFEPQGNYVIDSDHSRLPAPEVAAAPQTLVEDAQTVAERHDSRIKEKAELEARLRYLDEVLAAGALHARRILNDDNAGGLPGELQDKLKGMARQQR